MLTGITDFENSLAIFWNDSYVEKLLYKYIRNCALKFGE